MAEHRKLDPRDLDARLGSVRGWTIANGKLHKEFQFDNFVQAFGFMSSVGR